MVKYSGAHQTLALVYVQVLIPRSHVDVELVGA